MTQRKVTNSDMSGSHLLLKASESLVTFEQQVWHTRVTIYNFS
jgi:hypothetical protein